MTLFFSVGRYILLPSTKSLIAELFAIANNKNRKPILCARKETFGSYSKAILFSAATMSSTASLWLHCIACGLLRGTFSTG
jgi:hypothetical protein